MLPNEDFAIGDDAVFAYLDEPNITVVLDENYISTSKYNSIILDDVKALAEHNAYIIHMAKDIGFDLTEKEFC